jgi:hypothetical protein
MTAGVWGDRAVPSGQVDFTMMYAAHDAFTRDLGRLVAAGDRPWAESTAVIWEMFVRQLHVHHAAEDTALWPPLRAAVSRTEDTATLDAMEAEHGYLEPGIAAIEAARARGDWAQVATGIARLSGGLQAHMRHEETAALPLVEKHLGASGWARFGGYIRKTQGLRAAAVYFPWLLDDAPEPTRGAVLAVLPPPVRLLYRRVWAPRYRRG